MGSHVAALGVAVFAYHYAERHAANPRFTFGTGKVSALGGYTSALLLALVALGLVWESVERLLAPRTIAYDEALLVAVIGLVVNLASAVILGAGHEHDHGHGHAHGHGHEGDNTAHGHEHGRAPKQQGGATVAETIGRAPVDPNYRGAFLHVLSDLAGSVAAIVAGAIIYFTGWYTADTIVSLLIIALILFSSTRLLLEAFHILMEGAPRGLSMEAVKKALLGIDGVSGVHDLHAWSLSSGFNALTAHLIVKDPARQQPALKEASCLAAERFGIKHSVFQVESELRKDSSCDTCC
jgi:cation diffusion facilitator family transporter